MIDNRMIESEREKRQQYFEEDLDRLHTGTTSENRRHIVFGNLADDAQSISICEFLQDAPDTGREWMATAAEYYIKRTEATIELEDEIEGSNKAHRPKYCAEALHASLIGRAHRSEAIEQAQAIDEEWYLDMYPEFAHVYHYVQAFAAVLADQDENGRESISQYHELSDTSLPYDAGIDCLDGILAQVENEVVKGLDQLLDYHREEYGSNPSTPQDWVSVTARALFELATERDVSLSPDTLDADTAALIRE